MLNLNLFANKIFATFPKKLTKHFIKKCNAVLEINYVFYFIVGNVIITLWKILRT